MNEDHSLVDWNLSSSNQEGNLEQQGSQCNMYNFVHVFENNLGNLL